MKRILNWYFTGIDPDLPTFYMERNYSPVALRLYAKNKPNGGDLQVDIKDDGVSILTNYAIIPKGDNLEEDAEDFLASEPIIAYGSLVTCEIVQTNGANHITVQLELQSLEGEFETSE